MYPAPAQTPTATTGRSRVRSSAAKAVTAARTSAALPSGSSSWRGSPSLSPNVRWSKASAAKPRSASARAYAPVACSFTDVSGPVVTTAATGWPAGQVQDADQSVTAAREREGLACRLTHCCAQQLGRTVHSDRHGIGRPCRLRGDDDGNSSPSVDIGDGRTMFLDCMGEGEPTVILESGIHDSSEYWTESQLLPPAVDPPVMQGLAETNRVCRYDRPGTVVPGDPPAITDRSTPVEMPRTVAESVADLHTLLDGGRSSRPLRARRPLVGRHDRPAVRPVLPGRCRRARPRRRIRARRP